MVYFKKPIKIDFMTSKHGHKQLTCQTRKELDTNIDEVKNNAIKGALIVGMDQKGENVVVANNTESKETLMQILEQRNEEFQRYMVMPPITPG